MGLIQQLLKGNVWFLRNEDTRDEIKGQFIAEEVNKKTSSKYSKRTALNRKNPIVQFISGNEKTITFKATFFNRDMVFGKQEDELSKLESWAERDEDLGRTPILSFWIGNGVAGYAKCILENVDTNLMRPNILGDFKGATASLTLTKYQEFSLEGIAPGETRYHRAKEGDYYEILTYREYGNPLIGDVIRKRHPNKLNIDVADIIKLPSIGAIKTERVEQKSIPFKTSYGKKLTKQKELRLYMFELHNVSYISHIV